MSLKEATAEKHKQAENTAFMQAVFKRKITPELWADYTLQRSLIYNGIEMMADACGLLKDLPDLPRSNYLFQDFKNMSSNWEDIKYKQVAIDYHNYIIKLFPDSDRIMAHVYVWHMGDLFGGQALKKIVPGPHKSLEFKNVDDLKLKIRSKCKDSMAEEANIAFDWAIKLLNEYDVSSLE